MTTVFPAITIPSGAISIVACEPGESSCFFHANNRAGNDLRWMRALSLWPLLDQLWQTQILCGLHLPKPPSKSDPLLIDQAVLFDNIAIAVLALSVFTLTYLLLGLVVGLLTVCLAIVGWRYQRTLVRRSRFRFGIALILGLAGAGIWIFLLLLLIPALPRYA